MSALPHLCVCELLQEGLHAAEFDALRLHVRFERHVLADDGLLQIGQLGGHCHDGWCDTEERRPWRLFLRCWGSVALRADQSLA